MSSRKTIFLGNFFTPLNISNTEPGRKLEFLQSFQSLLQSIVENSVERTQLVSAAKAWKSQVNETDKELFLGIEKWILGKSLTEYLQGSEQLPHPIVLTTFGREAVVPAATTTDVPVKPVTTVDAKQAEAMTDVQTLRKKSKKVRKRKRKAKKIVVSTTGDLSVNDGGAETLNPRTEESREAIAKAQRQDIPRDVYAADHRSDQTDPRSASALVPSLDLKDPQECYGDSHKPKKPKYR